MYIVLFLLPLLTLTIITPMNMNTPRCFLVDTSLGQTLKVELELPQILGATSKQGYFASWKNTQTNDFTKQHIGTVLRSWKRELPLNTEVFYEFCYWAQGRQHNPQKLRVNIEMMKEWHQSRPRKHIIDEISSIVTREKVTQVTDAAFELNQFADNVVEFQARRFEREQESFYNIHEALKWTEYAGVVELLLLGVMAILQLFCILKITSEVT